MRGKRNRRKAPGCVISQGRPVRTAEMLNYSAICTGGLVHSFGQVPDDRTAEVGRCVKIVVSRRSRSCSSASIGLVISEPLTNAGLGPNCVYDGVLTLVLYSSFLDLTNAWSVGTTRRYLASRSMGNNLGTGVRG